MENKYKSKTKHYITLSFGKVVTMKNDKVVELNEYDYGLETYTEDNKLLDDYYIPEWELDRIYEDLLYFGFTQKYIDKLFKEKIDGKEGTIKLIVPNQKVVEQDIERIKKINKENGKNSKGKGIYYDGSKIEMGAASKKAYDKLGIKPNKKLCHKEIKKVSKQFERKDYKVKLDDQKTGCVYKYKDLQIRQKEDGSFRFEKALKYSEKKGKYIMYHDIYEHYIPEKLVIRDKFLKKQQIKACEKLVFLSHFRKCLSNIY